MSLLKSKTLTFTVIGGGGYIGFHVGFALCKQGHNVNLFDISNPDPCWINNALEKEPNANEWFVCRDHLMNDGSSGSINIVQGSVLDLQALKDVIHGADCVIHCASYGMSGLEQMPTEWDKTEEINVTGTENVLKVCLASGIRGLVYTSSVNVVFGGQEIINGDESLPYFPLHRHVDHYSRTKAIAEKLVLFSDGLSGESEISQQKPLRTCALRLAGVIGLEEKRHLPRYVNNLPLLKFRFGNGSSLQQFSTLKNVVQAHVKAAEQLLATPDRIGGQAYFITDGIPINSFDFFRPLNEALGYPHPTLKLPMWLIWFFVYAIQGIICFLLKNRPPLSFKPMLTPAEVYKTVVTHYFSVDKAWRHFGYVPERPNDISDVVQYYIEGMRLKEEEKTLTNRKSL